MTNAKALKDISDGRTSQLRTLLDAVAATRAGNARLCLVTGDSGSGKTTLLEILKRTVSGDENMMPTLASGSPKTVWAVETCRPDREFGPFWNILNSVSTQAAQSTAHGSDLLRSALGRVFTVLRFIFDVGPDGVAVADPITGLITKAAAYPIKIFLNDIENWSGLSHVPNIEDSSQIYELVWRALKFASESAPLVVVLDDLQEADEGSQALFFSLANQLNFHTNQRICLVGVYRRDHAGKRGLDGRLLRFRSKAMNPQAIGINLDETVGGDAGEAFVRGLFKSIPNGLTREFVNELFRRTQGHAQFTTDLLRFFLEKNILGFDANRKLVQLSEIDFRKLPDSVESLIAERLKLLDKSLRELVDIASVQGVEFGAEVILQINKISQLELFKALDAELATTHRLIEPVRIDDLDGSELHFYRFAMALHRQYLYQQLGPNYRQELHRSIAEALEKLYQNRPAAIASSLARHFLKASVFERAIECSLLAGRVAERRCAFDDAIRHFKQAEEIIETRSSSAHRDERYVISSSLMQIFSRQGRRAEAFEEMKKLEEIVGSANDIETAELCLFTAESLIVIGEYEKAAKSARRGMQIAKKLANEALAARAGLVLGEVGIYLGARRDAALEHLRTSLEFYERQDEKSFVARNTHLLALFYLKRGELDEAEHFAKKSLEMYRKMGDRIGENKVLRYLGDVSCGRGDYVDALLKYKKVYRIRREIGQRFLEGGAVGDIGDVYLFLGFYEKSLVLHEKSLLINEEVERKPGVFWCHHDLGVIHRNMAINSTSDIEKEAKLQKSIDELELAVNLAGELKDKDLHAMALNSLALSYIELGRQTGENSHFSMASTLTGESRKISKRASLRAHEIVGQIYDATATMCLGDAKAAMRKSKSSVKSLEGLASGSALPREEVLFLHAQILFENGENERSREFLQLAHQEVLAKANKIKFERMRTSFLNNVPMNRQIRDAIEAHSRN